MKNTIKEGLFAAGIVASTMVITSVILETSAFINNRKRVKKIIREGKNN